MTTDIQSAVITSYSIHYTKLYDLPAGWKYEGWAVINGIPVSTGTFTNISDFDEADPYSSTMPGPPFPGEDFLINAPAGLTFPTDIVV